MHFACEDADQYARQQSFERGPQHDAHQLRPHRGRKPGRKPVENPQNTAKNKPVSDLVHLIPPGRLCDPALAILLTVNRNSFNAETRKAAAHAPRGTSAPARPPADTVRPSAQSSATHFRGKPAPAGHPDSARYPGPARRPKRSEQQGQRPWPFAQSRSPRVAWFACRARSPQSEIAASRPANKCRPARRDAPRHRAPVPAPCIPAFRAPRREPSSTVSAWKPPPARVEFHAVGRVSLRSA